MIASSSKKSRSAMGVGLAFLVGAAVFGITFQLVGRYVVGGRYEPLTPIDKRIPGILDMPILPADSPATTRALSAAATEPSPPTWNLAHHKGKVVIVNYFATWCGPCVQETPDLVRIARDYGPRGVDVAAVSLDQEVWSNGKPTRTLDARLRAFARSYNIDYPILLPPDDSPLWKMEMPIPQTFLYDKQGRRRRLIVGRIDDRNLRMSLDELLKEPETPTLKSSN